MLDIKQMNNKEDYVEPTIQALEDYFSIDGDQVRAYAQNTRIPSIMSSKRECPTMKSVIISR